MASPNISANEELIKTLKSLRPEDSQRLTKLFAEIINANLARLLELNDFNNIRYIQGYTSAMVEILKAIAEGKEGI